jgi:hypothetical protein
MLFYQKIKDGVRQKTLEAGTVPGELGEKIKDGVRQKTLEAGTVPGELDRTLGMPVPGTYTICYM